MNNIEKEIKACKQAIRLNPDDEEFHFALGIAYGSSGMFEEAVEACEQAIKIDPDYKDAHYTLGVGYVAVGDRSSALEQYKILKELDTELANDLFNLIYK